MHTIRRTTQFKKDYKRLIGSKKDIEKLFFVINELANSKKLGPQYKVHQLKGKFKGKWDCHIEPDWLLLYSIKDNWLILYRTGSHSQLYV